MIGPGSLYTGREFWLPGGGVCFGDGPNLLVDGDMEAVGFAAWTPYYTPTITKEVVNPAVGSQCLKVACTGTALPTAYQTILTAGVTYLIVGYARGDGLANPYVELGGLGWYGTTSVEWQPFDFIRTATATSTNLAANTAVPGEYVEFDQVQVYRENGGVKDYYGIEGAGSVATVYDNYCYKPRLTFGSDLDVSGTKTIALNFRTSSIGAQVAFLHAKTVVATDYFALSLYQSKIIATSRAGDAYAKVSSTPLANNTWYRVLVTKTVGQTEKIYIDGVEVTTAAGAYSLEPPSYTVGMQTPATYLYNGDIGNVGIWDRILTDDEIASDYIQNRMR